jgi:hypothetical protein
MKKKYPHYLPKGWTLKEVQEVAAYYDNQSDEEAAAEDEAMLGADDETVMVVPWKLVPRIRKLIAEEMRRARGKARKVKRVA